MVTAIYFLRDFCYFTEARKEIEELKSQGADKFSAVHLEEMKREADKSAQDLQAKIRVSHSFLFGHKNFDFSKIKSVSFVDTEIGRLTKPGRKKRGF